MTQPIEGKNTLWQVNFPGRTLQVGDCCYSDEIAGSEDALFRGFVCFIEKGLLLWFYPDPVENLNGDMQRLYQWNFEMDRFEPVESDMVRMMLEGKMAEIRGAYERRTSAANPK